MTHPRFVSYAQNREDVMLWRALQHCTPGTYIDAGAAHPTGLSVTRAFYDRGWSGLNVEPLPEQAAFLAAARPRDAVVQAALSDAPGPPRRFYRVVVAEQTGLSTLDAGLAEQHRQAGAAVDTIQVPVTTLAALCRAYVNGPVHFLKIDVEGAEAAVLAGMDFHAVRPWILLVEATAPLRAEAPQPEWEPALLAEGYQHVWFDGLNRFYLADEHAALTRHFVLPPNVFDDYTLYDQPAQQHLAAAEALSEQRRLLIEELSAQLAMASLATASLVTSSLATPAPAEPKPPANQPSLQPPLEPPLSPSTPVPHLRPTPAPPAFKHPAFARHAFVRHAVLSLYRIARPVVRPLALRLRRFLTIELRQELDTQRHRLDQLLAIPPPPPPLPPPPPPPPDLERERLQARLLAAIETLLMTAALEDASRPNPPGLRPSLTPEGLRPSSTPEGLRPSSAPLSQPLFTPNKPPPLAASEPAPMPCIQDAPLLLSAPKPL